jgi:hypothetical protein
MILKFSLYVQVKAHWHGTSLRGKSASVNFRLRDGRQTTDQRSSPEFGIAFEPRFMGFRLDLGGFWLILTTCTGFLEKLVATIWLFQYSPRSVSLEGFGGDT